MKYAIVLTPEARDHLNAIYDYVAAAASPDIAQRFTDGILDHIEKLTDYPRRGTMRDDLRPGLRTIAWRCRTPGAAANFWPRENVIVHKGLKLRKRTIVAH